MNDTTSVLKKWHQFVETKDHKILDEILTEEVVFHSPVVWTPQYGKSITKLYLLAAIEVLGENHSDFTYTKEIVSKDHLVLEFDTLIDEVGVNGVDMMEINTEGKITSFKVMIRPLQAINKVHEKMGELLKRMQS